MKGKLLGTNKAIDPEDYPVTIELNEKKLPAIKNWKIGNKVKLVVEAEVSSLNNGYDNRGPLRATLAITSCRSAGTVSDSEPEAPKRSALADVKAERLRSKARSY